MAKIIPKKVICHNHSNNIYFVRYFSNFHFYKIPNILVKDRNENIVCITDFTEICNREYFKQAKFTLRWNS